MPGRSQAGTPSASSEHSATSAPDEVVLFAPPARAAIERPARWDAIVLAARTAVADTADARKSRRTAEQDQQWSTAPHTSSKLAQWAPELQPPRRVASPFEWRGGREAIPLKSGAIQRDVPEGAKLFGKVYEHANPWMAGIRNHPFHEPIGTAFTKPAGILKPAIPLSAYIKAHHEEQAEVARLLSDPALRHDDPPGVQALQQRYGELHAISSQLQNAQSSLQQKIDQLNRERQEVVESLANDGTPEFKWYLQRRLAEIGREVDALEQIKNPQQSSVAAPQPRAPRQTTATAVRKAEAGKAAKRVVETLRKPLSDPARIDAAATALAEQRSQLNPQLAAPVRVYEPDPLQLARDRYRVAKWLERQARPKQT